jgi:hypothetical protein
VSYELQTNDPLHSLIKVTVTAMVKPLPAFVKRLTSVEIRSGYTLAGFNVWPVSQPTVTLERGEKLDITLRLRPLSASSGMLALEPDAPAVYKLRHDASSNAYWLDLTAGPADASVTQAVPLVVTAADGSSSKLTLNLAIEVPAENLIVTPRELDLGESALSSLKTGQQKSGRIGIRKLVGSFHIKTLSSTLPFLKLEQQTIVEGSNYLIRVRIDAETLPKPGAYVGVLVIDIDDKQKLQIPVKLTLADR